MKDIMNFDHSIQRILLFLFTQYKLNFVKRSDKILEIISLTFIDQRIQYSVQRINLMNRLRALL